MIGVAEPHAQRPRGRHGHAGGDEVNLAVLQSVDQLLPGIDLQLRLHAHVRGQLAGDIGLEPDQPVLAGAYRPRREQGDAHPQYAGLAYPVQIARGSRTGREQQREGGNDEESESVFGNHGQAVRRLISSDGNGTR